MSHAFKGVLTAVLLATSLIFQACSGQRGPVDGGVVRLQGAGATFPNPLYQKWLSEYAKTNPNVRIDYQSIGSGGGIKQIEARTIDFGATDIPVDDQELSNFPREILHIPTVLGAVVLTYNLPELKEPLRFSPEVIADIFLGKIRRWDDARIKADNPTVTLPAADITVVHRSDGSGTTAVFTDYLVKISPEWKEKVGTGTSVKWPLGLGAKGNEGVTGQIKQTPNTIGYVELAYAVQNKLPVARIKNRSGNYIEPTLDSVTEAAAESAANMPADLRISITDAAGAAAYPIASYTYILVYKEQEDAAKGKALVDFLWWAVHDGQRFARELQYAPLPETVVRRVEEKLRSITFGGKPLRP
ncbi:MAG: phosphate ABC transporter substrate-binding protein PstS [Pyrinomonas sp.]|uniref:phosphate ABC transporter substrate-binding protein PstS n=1 Tax=Pyrinomonas sp. TaxID=2080306 RepID=UPI003325E2B0